MKKITAAAASLTAAVQLLSCVNAAAYTDMEGHWAAAFINSLTEEGVLEGDGGVFRPEDSVTVEEFLKMTLYAMNKEVPLQEGENWAQPCIEAALENGLIYKDEFDSYTRPITRKEIARITVRAIGADVVTGARREQLIQSIADYYDIYNEDKEYILAAYDNRIVNGYGDNSFRGDSNSTRAEAGVMVSRMMAAGNFQRPDDGNSGGIMDSGNVFYVAANAGPGGDGSEKAPFATLEQARDKVRAVIAAGAYPKGGITVYLRGGDYQLSSGFTLNGEDSGQEGAPVTYTSYPGEVARISGSRKLPFESFKTISSDMAAKLIDKAAAKQVLEIDLNALGFTDLGKLSRRGFLIAADESVQAELYVDGSRMQLAKWPNDSWVGTTEIVRSGARSQKGVLEGAVYKIDYDRPNRWKTNVNEIYTSGVLGPNYFYGYFPLEKIEPGQITLKEGSVTSYYSKHFIRYENVFEEIDAPGEYYIDRTAGKLYLYPTANFGAGSDIRLSMMTENLFGAEGVKNITLKNLKFEGTRASAIHASSVENFTVENCEVSGTGVDGIYVRGRNSAVKNNLVHDVGSNGIAVAGGDYANRISCGIEVVNNHVYKAAQIERSYKSGILLGAQSVGIKVSHNEVHDMPHAAMIVYGPDHTIEYNDIYDAVQEFHDMDAVYLNVNQYPWERNVVFRRNYIHDFGQQTFTEKQMNVAGIRSDNNGNGLQVMENVFRNIGYQNANGIRGICAQGIDNVVKNNIFVDVSGTYEGAHTYNPDAKWDLTSDSVKGIYEQWKIYSPKYSEKNPEVAKFYDHHFAAYEKNNIFKDNLVVNMKFPLGTANAEVKAQGFMGSDQLIDATGNLVMKEDPGFVNYAGGDFGLKPDSSVYKQIKDFPEIDFENIGTLPNEAVGITK